MVRYLIDGRRKIASVDLIGWVEGVVKRRFGRRRRGGQKGRLLWVGA